MSYPLTAIRAAALALGLAGMAAAETSVDSVYDLPPVQAIEVSDTGQLLITMPERVLRMDSFPLKVTGDVAFQLANARATMAGQDTLVVLGDADPEAVGGGTFHIYRDLAAASSDNDAPIALSIFGDPFSQLMTGNDKAVYAVSPTWFAATQISVPRLLKFLEGEDVNFTLGNLFLQCGKVNQLSVFDFNDAEFYVASLAGSKVLEYGPLKVDEKSNDGSECFDTDTVAQAKGDSKFAGARSVTHGLIAPFFEEDPKQILVLDGDAGTLSLYPMLEYRRSLAVLRSEAISFDLRKVFTASDVPASRSGLLATDEMGAIIWVSYLGSKSVQRFKATEDGFEFLGTLRFRDPVQALDVSGNGVYASVVTAPEGGSGDQPNLSYENQVTIVRDPGSLAPKAALPRARFSVLELQEALSEAGVAVAVDGILGIQTRDALEAFEPSVVKSSQVRSSASISVGSSAPQPKPTLDDLKSHSLGILPVQN